MQKRVLNTFADKRARINGIPVMNATMEQDGDGILRISLVDWPAVESDFLTFHKDTPKQAAPAAENYKIFDEERRIIYGVVMRADFPIYRYDEQNGEYFIVFTKDVIRAMAEKYLAEGRQNDVNVMHLAGSDVEGVEMVQFFIKDTAAGINPAGFEVIEDGSLFAEFHVLNDDVWEACKAGEYRGFSIEVFNGMTPATQDFAAQLESLFTNSKENMKKKVETLKNYAAKMVAKFKSITTDKGVLEWDGEEDAVEGTKVFIPGEGDAERQPAPDGDYTDPETGTVFTVADGAIVKIVTKAEDDPEDLRGRIEELEAEVEGLEDVIEQVINHLNEMGAEFKAFKKQPAADPAHKRFAAAEGKDGKKGFAHLAKILGGDAQ